MNLQTVLAILAVFRELVATYETIATTLQRAHDEGRDVTPAELAALRQSREASLDRLKSAIFGA